MIKRVEDLVAYQFAEAFKDAVYELIDASPAATRDFPYANQLRSAASSAWQNVGEGFDRRHPGQFAWFLRIADGSAREAVRWIHDGIKRRHFTLEDAADALERGRLCGNAIRELHKVQVKQAEIWRRRKWERRK